MYHKTIFHILPSGEKAKFTIRDRIIDGERFYYANFINVELDIYTNLTDQQKETYYGMEITNGRQQVINYRDAECLLNDILTKYGHKLLETEK